MEVDLSVVIPVYRSAVMLPALVERLLRVLGDTRRGFEVVLVEDGSPDDSWEVLRRLQQAHPDRLTVVQLMRNYGQQSALMCGLRHSRGRFVVTMDDDLQHPPEEIPRLLREIEATGLDLVYGAYGAKKHSRWRNIGSSVINAFFRSAFGCSVTISSFRIMRRPLVDTILAYPRPFIIIDGLLAWNTQRIGMVTVEHHPRAAGRSGYSLSKLVKLTFDLFTNFSLAPLHLVSACGLLAAGGGVLMGIYYLVQYLLSNISVPGYASLMIVVLVMGGVQLLSMGIMGQYLGRVHLNVNRKPQYAEREVLGNGSAGPVVEPAPLHPEENISDAA